MVEHGSNAPIRAGHGQTWVLRGGRVIDPGTGRDETADLVVEKGVVSAVGRGASESAAGIPPEQLVDCSGKWVVPGFIDLHVHLREPGQEHKETIATGLKAAAAGGFTAVCPMPNTSPVNDCRAITEAMRFAASRAEGARLFPIAAATKNIAGQELSEMGDLREGGAIGVSDDGHCISRSSVMRRALEYAANYDLLVSQHAEDHDLTSGAQMNEGRVSTKLGLRGWPKEAEDIIVARDLILTESIGGRYHVAHISSGSAVRLVREAKARGIKVSAEVTPHHLLLTEDAVVGYDTYCKVNPPLRTEQDRTLLLEALKDGTIDCIATDHAPHAPVDKECEFEAAALGINGLETALASLLHLVRCGALSPTRLIESLSTAPARIVPEIGGGGLRVGDRADIAIIDPDYRWILKAEAMHSQTANTPFLEKQMQGCVTHTFVGGALVYSRHMPGPSA